MNLSIWISILSLVVSLFTLAVSGWLYGRMSKSQMDDNIMNATNSILTLLERAKKLGPTERHLLIRWLDDWDYFRPPHMFSRRSGPKATDETIEKLRLYFKEIGNKD